MTARIDSGDDLVLRARSDRDALGTLYDRYYPGVLRYCVHRMFDRGAAEDATASVFLDVARQIRQFTGSTEADFANWLYAIATNHVHAAMRKSHRQRKLFTEAAQRGRIHLCTDENSEAGHTLDWPRLYDAIATLEPREQAVITLRSFEDLPYERIATVVGTRTGTARVIYHRALNRLRAYFARTSEDA